MRPCGNALENAAGSAGPSGQARYLAPTLGVHRYRQHATGSSILVVHAPRRTTSPTLPEHVIAEAEQQEPVGGAAESQPEFRRDIDSFAPADVVDADPRDPVRWRRAPAVRPAPRGGAASTRGR